MWGVYDKDSEAWAIVHQGANPHGGWSSSDLTDTGNFIGPYFLREAGGPVPPPSPTPGPTPTPPGTKHCSARGGCDCDCSWARPSTCGWDDGSCCHGCCCPGLLS